MKLNAKNINMLQGPLTKPLLLFTLPIALSSMLQQLFNAADTVIVGLLESESALAAVGANAEIVALIVTVSGGLAVGANVAVANCVGKNKPGQLPGILQAAALLAAAVGLLGALLGQAAVNPLLQLMNTPAQIFLKAAQYLRIYLLGYPFLLLYDFGAAMLRAQGNSRFPFFALALSGVLNVGLNLAFVIFLRMGVAGVAAATSLSNACSAVLVLTKLYKGKTPIGRLPGWGTARMHCRQILKTGLPSALQGAVFCLANLFVQTAVNGFGPSAIAGSTVAVNFEYFTYYIITAFGQTATTFTGQNFAAGQLNRCKKVLKICLWCAFLGCAAVILPVVLFRSFFAGLFSANRQVVYYAGVRMVCILLLEPICAFYEIPAGVLRGAGHAGLPAASSILGICVFRVIWVATVFAKAKALWVLYLAFPLSWAVTVALTALSFAYIVRYKL